MKTLLLLVRQGKYRKLQGMARRWKRLPEWMQNLSDVEIGECSGVWRATLLGWREHLERIEQEKVEPSHGAAKELLRCKRCHEFMGSVEEMARHECKE